VLLLLMIPHHYDSDSGLGACVRTGGSGPTFVRSCGYGPPRHLPYPLHSFRRRAYSCAPRRCRTFGDWDRSTSCPLGPCRPIIVVRTQSRHYIRIHIVARTPVFSYLGDGARDAFRGQDGLLTHRRLLVRLRRHLIGRIDPLPVHVVFRVLMLMLIIRCCSCCSSSSIL
jgi:hypothetical protein